MKLYANIEAEQSILGGILLNNELYFEVAETLRLEDFSLLGHQKIYFRMIGLMDAGQPIDTVTLANALDANKEMDAVGGMEYVVSLLDGLPDRPSLTSYANIIAEKSKRRRVLASASSFLEKLEDGSESADKCIAYFQDAMFEIQAATANQQVRHLREILPDVMREMELQSQATELIGYSTGLDSLDQALGGIRKGEICTIGALPGRGKTSLLVQIALANAKPGHHVGVFSGEMSDEELTKRMVIADSDISSTEMRHPRVIKGARWGELGTALGRMAEYPVWIDDRGGLKMDKLIATARMMIRRHAVEIILVDYLQILDAPGRDLREKVGNASKALTALAKSEHVAVVQLSQLGRPKDKKINARPTMIDLKESGDIEAHSHIILLPYMPLTEDGELVQDEQLIVIGKARSSAVGSVPTWFDPKRLQFRDRT